MELVLLKIIEDKVFLMYGAPRRIITNNSVQFEGKDFNTLLSRYNVSPSFISIIRSRTL